MITLYSKVLVLFTLLTNIAVQDVPKGWTKAGSMAAKYETGTITDKNLGSQVAYLRSVDDEINGFGTLMQQFSAGVYKGKRLRLSGWMKAEQVKQSAGFWMRIDQNGTSSSLAFDNMSKRPVKGDAEWTRYEIVLDVPENADLVSFGALLTGTGQVLIDNLRFDVVDNSVPTTAPTAPIMNRSYPQGPINLDFQQ